MKAPSVARRVTDVDALRTVVALAMERLCFASPDSFSEAMPADRTVDACVDFRGPVSGAVGVAIPAAALRGFLDALLLPDARIDRLVPSDFVAELASIVCGNVVPRIFGRNSIYVLSPPQLLRPSAPAIATAVVHVAGGWVAATLHRYD